MPQLLNELLRRRVLFVTGKGGVGKSSVAAALARIGADKGLRTLVIDVDGKGDAARFLDAAPTTYDARRADDNLFHLAMEPEKVLDEYMRLVLKLPRFYRLGPLHKVFDFIATAAPGVREVLIAGKVGFEERADDRKRWDLIVVDSSPIGQILAQLRGPRTLQELVGAGMIRTQTDWVRDIIEDPNKTGIVVVSLPEEMPVSETAELIADAPNEVRTPVLAIVANRVIKSNAKAGSLKALHTKAVTKAAGASIGVAADAAGLYRQLAKNQTGPLARLHELGPEVIELPVLGITRHNAAVTRQLAKLIVEGAS